MKARTTEQMNRREGAGREGDDGDDDGCLHHWLRFYVESEFHPGEPAAKGEMVGKGLIEGKSV